MNWTFATVFAVLWAVGMETANNLGASVHLLLFISGIFALVAVVQRHKLNVQNRTVLAAEGARAWNAARFGK